MSYQNTVEERARIRRAKNPVSPEWKRMGRKDQLRELTRNWRVLPSVGLKPHNRATIKEAFK